MWKNKAVWENFHLVTFGNLGIYSFSGEEAESRRAIVLKSAL